MVITREVQLGFLLTVLIFLVYWNGVSGPFFYDDYGNLERLTAITDLPSFLKFSLSGYAGPSGRPISVASLALQAGSWPDNPRAFLVANILIHTANALLLFAIFRVVLKDHFNDKRGLIVAFAAALLWGLLPINVSASLITVQRMTGLSVFFGLCGLSLYLWAYRLYANYPVYLAFFLQFGLLGLCTVLSILCKESGALFPVYGLVLEVTLLRELSRLTAGRRARLILLSTLLAALLVYLSPLSRDWWQVDDFRGFSAWERVRSEWVYLWDYVRMILLPRPTEFSPFHDDVEIVKNGDVVFIAGASWLVAISLAFFIRQKTVWPLFAMLWFFTGHLIESTSILLELVYEHRNYLASYGVVIALVVVLFSLPDKFGRARDFIVFGYIAIVGLICFGLTSIWGKPLQAAEIWSAENPRSSRAALHLATLDIEASGGSRVDASMSILARAKRDRRIVALDRTINKCPECTAVKLQAILLACGSRGEEEVQIRFQQIMMFAGKSPASRPVVDALFPFVGLADANACQGLKLENLVELIKKLRHSKFYGRAYYQSRLAYLLAEIAYRQGNIAKAKTEVDLAENADPAAFPVLKMQVHLAIEQEDWGGAVAAIVRRQPLVNNDLILTANVLSEMLDDVNQLKEGSNHKNVQHK